MNTSVTVPQNDSQMIHSLRPDAHLSPLGTLWDGAKLALGYWPVWLIMFLSTLLLAVLVALIPSLDLMELAHRPVIERMAEGIPSWAVVDLVGLMSGGAVLPGAQEVATSLSLLMFGFVLMPLLGGLVSAFLYGGVLLTYFEAPKPFRLGRFFWGCWHWFGGFLLLALLQAILFLFILLPLAGGLVALGTLGSAAQWVALALFVLLMVLWVMLFELARTRMVVTSTRNPFLGIGRAFVLLFRQPLLLLGYYGAAVLVLLALQAVFRLWINPNIPLGALLLALLVQQGFVTARLFTRAMRLAGLMRMGQQERPVVVTVQPEPAPQVNAI
jgi:hypothetical protein